MGEIIYDNYYWQNDLVRLRPWSEDDWEWMYCTGFDSSLSRLASYKVDLPPTVSGSKEYSKKVENFAINDCSIVFAIETLASIHVGRVILVLDDDRHGTFGFGVRIASEYQGKGYGTSAMKILINYAFMEKRLNKCSSNVLEGNEPSIKMHEKLGFDQEGVFKQNIFTNGRYYDELFFGLTRDIYLKMTDSNDNNNARRV